MASSFPTRRATDLPIEEFAPAITEAIRGGSLVLTAEPGAGKTSVIPLLAAEVIAGSEQAGRVLLLQPRRLAARAAAQRLTSLLSGDRPLGGVVGLTMRGEHRVSDRTRIEVMTEAVLTARLQRDPELPGVATVIFDEFHERNLHSDLGLGMALDARSTIRPDLTLVVMSATLDTEPVADLMASDNVIDVPGRTYPIETVHLERPTSKRWASVVADTTRRALADVEGDVLVFVPGRREIDDVTRLLTDQADRADRADRAEDVIGLHGGSDSETRRRVLQPGAGRRVVVATSVAETSVTLPGIEAVVDGGLARRARFDHETGLGRLETVHVTRFSADQRRGRAGRLGPGRCYRLWSPEDHRHLEQAAPPEITDGDPLPVAFELSRWGDPDGSSLPLLDHPGAHRLAAGRSLLAGLNLVSDNGSLTGRGRDAGRLGLHPRLGSLLLTAAERRQLDLGATVAALLDDDRRSTTTDLAAELDQRGRRLHRAAERLIKRLPGTVRPSQRSGPPDLPALLVAAWPDRVAMRREGRDGSFLLANGREARVPTGSPLAGSEFLVVAEADGEARSATIRRAVATDRATVLSAIGPHLVWTEHVEWDDRSGSVTAERRQRIGALILHREPLAAPQPGQVTAALTVGLQRRGLDLLSWSENAIDVRHRLAWLHQQRSSEWPAVDDQSLLDRIDDWLDLSRCRSIADIGRLHVGNKLLDLLDWQQRSTFESMAPASLCLPNGTRRRLDYSSGRPVWSVRLQQLLGLDNHPTIGPENVPVTIELLSPANRPAQVTTDLPGFWRGTYRSVRADLRGRYPKHAWPERPWEPPPDRPRNRPR